MTTSPAAATPGPDGRRVLHLSELVGRPITDRSGESIGRLADIIVRLRGDMSPLVTGIVAALGAREIFVPLEQASSFDGAVLRLTSARLDLRRFERRPGEVLLRADVLGYRLIDVRAAHLIKAVDLELRNQDGEWVLAGVDTRRRPRGLLRLFAPAEAGRHEYEEWARFEPLIGHAGSALVRGPFGRIRRLKPAQIADLLEEASRAEESEILSQVHADPELEADVFSELDEDAASRLFGARTDAEIAAVLTRMGADDAADAIAELPQRRRQAVIDLLAPGQRAKVLTLMGFNPATAGGLMGMDFVALPSASTAAEALAAVRRARSIAPAALTSVHALDAGRRLCGVVTVAALLQADPAARLTEVYDDDPVRIGAGTDVADVAVLMSDYNLLTVPVVDDDRTMLGLVTVDDVLEVTLPGDWRRREAAEPPDSRHGRNA